MSSTNEGGTKKTSPTDTNRAEPSDSVQRNAALRNHRVQFEDADNANAERVQTARKNDIIFGRGIGLQRHPGNQRMREIIDRYKVQYQALARTRKRDLAEAVYNEIVEGGARFLTKSPDEDTFFVVDVPTALLKVSYTLRCKKSLNRAVNNQKEARAQSALNHRIQFEDADNANAERVQTARKNDIIFGRGIGLQRHPGNQRMREIVDRYKEQYQSVERARKRDVVEAAYNEIVEGGARFLAKSPDEDTFFVAGVPTALLKVSHTLRCTKSLRRAVTTETAREHLREPSDSNDQKEARAQSALHVDNSTPYAVGRAGIPSIESLLVRRDQTLPLNLGMPVSSGSGLGHTSLPLNLGARPVSEAMEAQRLAVARRYSTFAGIPGMPLGLTNTLVPPSSIEYYNLVRRDQLMREILLLQQIGSALRLNAGSRK